MSVRGGRVSVRRLMIVRPAGLAELGEFALELGQRVPVPGHQHEHRELVAERGHAAFEDVAATIDDDAGQVVDQPRAVIADCGNRDELFHGFLRRAV